MMEEKSVYEKVLENITNGTAASDCIFSDVSRKEGLSFVDGAQDGIAMYHIGFDKPDAAAAKLMRKAIHAICKTDFAEADRLFSQLGESIRAIGMADELQGYVLQNRDKLTPDAVYNCGLTMLLESHNVESVKFALELLELVEMPDEKARNAVRKIALCNEFTIFAVWVMRQWENGNDEIFDTVRKASGWGRIHALEFLEPKTDEIADWFFYHGVENDVMSGYSALTAWEKSGAEKRLNGKLSYEEFNALTALLEALFDEGPAKGISSLGNAEEIVLRWLSQSEGFHLSEKHYDLALTMLSWSSEENADHPDISSTCRELLSSDECGEAVREAAKNGNGVRLARALQLDCRREFLDAIAADFERNFSVVDYVAEDDELLNEAVELFTRKLPIEKIRTETVDSVAPEGDLMPYHRLNSILSCLRGRSFVAEELVVLGLHSPYIGNRTMALTVIRSWCDENGALLKELDPELYDEVCKQRENETDRELIRMETCVITGEYDEDECDDQ